VVCCRHQYWGQYYSTTSLMIWMTEQKVPSASLQMTHSWEQWLTGQRVVLPSRGTSAGWGHGLRGASRSSANGNAESCPWGGTAPGTRAGWGQPAGKQLCRRGPQGPGGHQVDHEPATSTCGEGGRQPPGLPEAEHHQQVEGGGPSPLLRPGETHLECWVQCWALQYKTWTYWGECSKGPQRWLKIWSI